MTSFPFSDDFESYPLGSSPAGWVGSPWDNAASSATVLAGGATPASTQCALIGKLQTDMLATGQASVSHRLSIFLPVGSSLTTGAGIIDGQLGGGGYVAFRLGLNGDARLYVEVGDTIASHQRIYIASSLTSLNRDTWYDIVANVIFDADTDPTGILVQVNLSIDGVEEINVSKSTQVLPTSLGAIDQWIFNPGTVSGMVIDNIEVTGPGGSITPPVATEPANVHQHVMEAVHHGDPKGIVYQHVLEVLLGPPTSKGRVYEA